MIRTCVFDAYGTLFDVHSAVARHARAIGPSAPALSELWRRKQLEYSWIRSLMGRHADFETLTAEALDYALASFGMSDGATRRDLLAAYRDLTAYPEVVSVLEALKQRGITTAILSNGTPAMLDAAVTAAGLAHLLDAVISIEDAGVYKTDPRTYALVTARLGVEPGAVSFQSSNAWDAAGAAAFGFRVVWVNRAGQPVEYGLDRTARIVDSLRTLPELLDG